MSEYTFYSLIKNRDGLSMEVYLRFRYYQPVPPEVWQDKNHGNVEVLEICPTHHSPSPLTLTELIHARHACWDYLEQRQLYKKKPKVSLCLVPSNNLRTLLL